MIYVFTARIHICRLRAGYLLCLKHADLYSCIQNYFDTPTYVQHQGKCLYQFVQKFNLKKKENVSRDTR